MLDAERRRLNDDAQRAANWKRWGPYLPDRQWGTVREDYSADGTCWDYFPHDHARSRAYRWGEDGLLGFTDRQCRLCIASAFWNGQDPILKERLFGLTGSEGNHGEDVKECYYFLEATPTASWCKALYKYPQQAFPYDDLVAENRRRGLHDLEYELADSGVFDEQRYFDCEITWAKGGCDDVLLRLSIHNRGPEAAPIWVLPQAWFRNTWIWGCKHEGCGLKPRLEVQPDGSVSGQHESLGTLKLWARSGDATLSVLTTENETNSKQLWDIDTYTDFTKDAFHRYLIEGDESAVDARGRGTKVGFLHHAEIPAGESCTVDLRLCLDGTDRDPWQDFDDILHQRHQEYQTFYQGIVPQDASEDEQRVLTQAYAGLVWSKKFYHYIVTDWLDGDDNMPDPPAGRKQGRNSDWRHLYNRDVISMPDAWEYPWYAAWDLAFHMLPFAKIDPEFAKEQLVLFLREWYLHPNGQIPAYEFAFGDVNPPVHAWACWRVYKMSAAKGERDRLFLARCFQKLGLNLTWWVNRKDPEGNNLFAGGFLGLDNIGVFDRSKPLPGGGKLQQADGTAWMAFACGTMLSMALELAQGDPAYGDMASKYFEHFVRIVDALNHADGTGLWDEQDGFYYDRLAIDGSTVPLRTRSLVGLVPLIAVEVYREEELKQLPGFWQRLQWFLRYETKLARHVIVETGDDGERRVLLSAVPIDRLPRLLERLVDEAEFLSDFGIRSLSRAHADKPFVFTYEGEEHQVAYTPGESDTWLFGGNSNWRGPIWFPLAYLIVEALQRYHHFYGDSLTVTMKGAERNLAEVADEVKKRLFALFTADEQGQRPCHGDDLRYSQDPYWKDLVQFYEYFHGDSGRGCGASHQTGWTALVTRCR